MAAGLVPLAPSIPLMRAASLYGERFWTPPALGHLPYTYRNLLYPTLLPASIFLVVGATVWAWRGAPSRLPTPARLRAAWVPDLVACVTLFLVPVFAVAISFGVGGFRDRYAIAMVLGFGGVIGLCFGLAGSPVMTRLAVAVLAIWVLARSLPSVVPLIAGAPPPDVLAVHPLLTSNRLPPDGEIAIPNDAIYTQLAHYADPALRSRLRMLLPPSATPDRRLETSSERAMRALARWHPVALQEYADLLASKQSFLLYGEPEWAVDQLTRDRITLTLVGGGSGGRALFLATP
jgi:hypothetical protein